MDSYDRLDSDISRYNFNKFTHKHPATPLMLGIVNDPVSF